MTAQSTLILTLGGLLGVAGYALACWVWPFGPCGKCKGQGRKSSPSGRYWRDCKRCGGTGRKIRTGRRLFTMLKGGDAHRRRPPGAVLAGVAGVALGTWWARVVKH